MRLWGAGALSAEDGVTGECRRHPVRAALRRDCCCRRRVPGKTSLGPGELSERLWSRGRDVGGGGVQPGMGSPWPDGQGSAPWEGVKGDGELQGRGARRGADERTLGVE